MKKVRVKFGMTGVDANGKELKAGAVLTVDDDFVVPNWLEVVSAGGAQGDSGAAGGGEDDETKAQLIAQAKGLGINATSRWGVDTLREHIKAVLVDEAMELGIEGADGMDIEALEQAVAEADGGEE